MVPAPETATGKLVRRQAKRGPAPSRWEACTTCRGEGSTTDRFGRPARCERCRGRGRRKVDDYTNEEVASESPFFSWREEFAYLLERDTQTATCPFCDGKGVYKFARCTPCRGSGRVPIAGSWLSDPEKPRRAGGDAVDLQLDAMERREDAGDWRHLDPALVELRRRAPTCYRLVRDVFMVGSREEADVDELEAIALRGGVLYLDSVLPHPLTVPSWVAKAEGRRLEHLRTVKGWNTDGRALGARNKEIERDLRQEKPLQWIAQHYGLSVRQLYEIKAAMKRRAQGGT